MPQECEELIPMCKGYRVPLLHVEPIAELETSGHIPQIKEPAGIEIGHSDWAVIIP